MTVPALRLTRGSSESVTETHRSAVAGFSPELRLVLALAYRELPPGQRERIRELIQSGLDWGEVLRLASAHGMVPLVHWHLEAVAGDLVPAPHAATLRGLFRENLGWQMSLVGELQGLLAALDLQEIPAVPYKGPVLAQRLYGSIILRQSSDLDILVRRRDVERSREILLSRGYQPQAELTAAGRAFMLRSRYSETFVRADGLTVELHWAFTNQDVSFPLRLEDLLPRLERLRVGRDSVPVMNREDLLLILCVHGAKHLWARLEWICGVAELIRSSGPLDWDELLKRSRVFGVERMLLLGLAMAHDLLDAPLPPHVERRIREHPHVAELIEEVVQFLATPEIARESAEAYGSLRHDILHFRLRERLRDRVRFLWYRVTTPSQPENWVAVSVGRWSFPVHALLRPLQVATKLAPATVLYVRKLRERRSTP